jgi:hypothetical protein
MTEPSLDHETKRQSWSLAGGVAIVAGAGVAADGIGNSHTTAIVLAENGRSVVCIYINLALAERTVEMIKAEGKVTLLPLEDWTPLQLCRWAARWAREFNITI